MCDNKVLESSTIWTTHSGGSKGLHGFGIFCVDEKKFVPVEEAQYTKIKLLNKKNCCLAEYRTELKMVNSELDKLIDRPTQWANPKRAAVKFWSSLKNINGMKLMEEKDE